MAGRRFRQEFRARTVGFIATAFGLVVGLAWNDAVKTFIEIVFPLKSNTIVAKFIYAGVLTIIVVSVITVMMKLVEESDGKK